jgi:hypothetical protein
VWTDVLWTGPRLEVPTPRGLRTSVQPFTDDRSIFLPGFFRVAAGDERPVRRVRHVAVTVEAPGAPAPRTAIASLDRDDAHGWAPEDADALYFWSPGLDVLAQTFRGPLVLKPLPPGAWHVFADLEDDDGVGYGRREGTEERVVLRTERVPLRQVPTVGGAPLPPTATLHPGRLDTQTLATLADFADTFHGARGLRWTTADFGTPHGVLDVPVHTATDPERGVAYLEPDAEGRLAAAAWEPGVVSVVLPGGGPVEGRVDLKRVVPSTGAVSTGGGPRYRRALKGAGRADVLGLPYGTYRAEVEVRAADGSGPVTFREEVVLTPGAPRATLTPP